MGTTKNDGITDSEADDFQPPRDDAALARLKEIERRFGATPEYKQLFDVVADARTYETTKVFSLKVDKGLLPLIAFLHARDMELENKPVNDMRDVLSAILNHELRDWYRTAAEHPLEFAYYQAVWNRICDELGYPEEKVPRQEPPDPDMPF